METQTTLTTTQINEMFNQFQAQAEAMGASVCFIPNLSVGYRKEHSSEKDVVLENIVLFNPNHGEWFDGGENYRNAVALAIKNGFRTTHEDVNSAIAEYHPELYSEVGKDGIAVLATTETPKVLGMLACCELKRGKKQYTSYQSVMGSGGDKFWFAFRF